MTDIVDSIDAWDRCYPGNLNIEVLVDDAKIEITRLRQLLSEAEKSEREARAKALGDAASAIFVMGAWSPHYEKLVPNTFDEGTSAAYEIVREIQGKAESALQSEER